MSGLTDEQKAQIRQIRSSHDLIGAIKEVRKLVGVTLAEAQNILASLK
jgi:ribosomal protein L7/L12